MYKDSGFSYLVTTQTDEEFKKVSGAKGISAFIQRETKEDGITKELCKCSKKKTVHRRS